MPYPSYKDSIKKLVEDICATSGSGSTQYDHAKAILDVKLQEMVVAQTKRLTFATWVLAFASVALVIATIGLIFVSIK
ncbi:MAG: hypothetical protein ACYDIA_05470 [Candidatus Humimicrobiaceae bacterium]